MKKSIKIICLTLSVIFLLSVFVGCSKSDIPDGFQLIAREGDTFRLYVPTQGWMPNTSGGITSAYYSVSNQETGAPACSVSVYLPDDADGVENVEDYWKICEEKLKAEIAEYKFEESGDESLGGQLAKRYVYTGKMTVNDKQVDFKFMLVMAIHEGRLYALLYSAPVSEYDKRLEDIKGNGEHIGVIGNFKFAEAYKAEDDKKYSDKEEAPDGMKLASSKERPYVLFCPDNWQIEKGADITTVYTEDRSNVSVQYTMPENSDYSSEKYFEESIKKYENILDGFLLNPMTDVEIKKVAGVDNSVIASFSGSQGGVTYKFKQAIVLKGEVYYTVTYTAKAENFDKHVADFDKMLENFNIR